MSRSAEATIAEVDAPGLAAAGDGVTALLADGVASDAELGFLAPLDPALAATWLEECGREVEARTRRVWLAHDDEGLVGMVQLALATEQNARHRAEVQKVVVHHRARGRGIGERLMATLENGARESGRWLLLLDTDADSPAVDFYRGLGWQSVGVIPAYSLSASGAPQGSHVFYRDLREGP